MSMSFQCQYTTIYNKPLYNLLAMYGIENMNPRLQSKGIGKYACWFNLDVSTSTFSHRHRFQNKLITDFSLMKDSIQLLKIDFNVSYCMGMNLYLMNTFANMDWLLSQPIKVITSIKEGWVKLRCNRWSLGIDKLFHPKLYSTYDYIFMLAFKLKHVSERWYWKRRNSPNQSKAK